MIKYKHFVYNKDIRLTKDGKTPVSFLQQEAKHHGRPLFMKISHHNDDCAKQSLQIIKH